MLDLSRARSEDGTVEDDIIVDIGDPFSDDTVSLMATGPEGEVFDLIGQRYAEIFARNNVKLVLKQTEGSVDNIKLLNDPRSGVSVTIAGH